MPLTKADLDNWVCSIPGCTDDHSALTIHSKCHIVSPTWAKYDKSTGILKILCAEKNCGRLIMEIQIQ